MRAERIAERRRKVDDAVLRLYRGGEPTYVDRSILDGIVSPIGLIVAAILILSVLPFVAPLFLFELPDLTQTLVDGCGSGSRIDSELDCSTQPWLHRVAVAENEATMYVALDPDGGATGDWFRVTFPSDAYVAERGTSGVWAVTKDEDPEFATVGVVTKTQNGFEMLSVPISGDLVRWAVSTSRSRTPPTGLYRTPELSTLTGSVSIPSWTPWVILVGLLVWGFRAGTPSRVTLWVRWGIFLVLVGWALSSIKPHLDESLGRYAASVNYPVVVPIGFAAAMAIGIPLIAFVVARSLARQLPRWSMLSTDREANPKDVVVVKCIGAGALVVLTYVAITALDAGVARLFPGFTI